MAAGDIPNFQVDASEGGYYLLMFRNPSNFGDPRPEYLLLIGAVYVKSERADPEIILPRERMGEVINWKSFETMFPLILPGADPREQGRPQQSSG